MRMTPEIPPAFQIEQRLTLGQVMLITGMGRTWIYRQIAKKEFPEPERAGRRCSRWRAGDVLNWLEDRRAEGDSNHARN